MANFFKVTPKTQKLGQQCTVKISRLDANGCGVGQYQQKNIFIDGTLPSETVVAKVIEQKSKYFRGKLVEIHTAAEHREKPGCQHFTSCGGCDLQHLGSEGQLSFKQQKITELFARNEVIAGKQYNNRQLMETSELPWQRPITNQTWYYRHKARIGVQYNKKGQATVGFRQKASNQLVAIKTCPVLVEPFDSIFHSLNEILANLSGKNPIGHIEIIATNVKTLIIRQLEKMSVQDRTLWLAFAQQHQCQIMLDDGKSILPLTDCEALSYQIENDINITFYPENFIQVNHQVNLEMVARAIEWLAVTPQDIILDLFCGLGNFSLPLAKNVKKVVGVEGVDEMVVQAQNNAQANQLTNCQFYQADLNSDWQLYPWTNETFTKVLIDPARAGAYKAIEQLVKLGIKQLLYVSCDPATLAKDSKLLISHGYKIEKISLIDMFSHTKHIETMVLFVR
ncbi:23S rRNA (uracil(1939)-C(5))-methyltransferase RlmD [Colwellia sp. 1_MG-2023]|uniref:23S rRNA (uracil(1939)-C(5))-methyltransferase RlmD n=1 Tax=Colwellia sp. 1_MG-2023 TaxID=3062649 RepID=UPI0026E194D3|nr:23S rRNA (uracil(1939)-C(5))-methyltransferase RlmD [Colwellia sp. 1_MG-2023]MDO6446599.1 23S rRNA (uracil(1939)-C(5))-methyltransferase RlmD [Colwellia sp. 1_MG-2023]